MGVVILIACMQSLLICDAVSVIIEGTYISQCLLEWSFFSHGMSIRSSCCRSAKGSSDRWKEAWRSLCRVEESDGAGDSALLLMKI